MRGWERRSVGRAVHFGRGVLVGVSQHGLGVGVAESAPDGFFRTRHRRGHPTRVGPPAGSRCEAYRRDAVIGR
jgi:hypothetical protein